MMSKPEELKEFIVIDAESHIVENPEDIEKFLDKKYRLPMIVRDEVSGTRYWIIDGKMYTRPFGFGGGEARGLIDHTFNKFYGKISPKLKAKDASLNDIDGRLADLDQMGVDIQIVNPTSSLIVPFMSDKDWAYAMARAYNDYVASRLKYTKRVYANAVVPVQDVNLAIKEMERAKELGFKGVIVPSFVSDGHFVALKPIFHEDYFPFFKKASELNMPIVVHITPTSSELPWVFLFNKYLYVRGVGHPYAMMITLMGLIGEGFFERLPTLKVHLCEAGASWLPYWIWWLDEAIESPRLRKYSLERFGIDPYPYLKKLASEYLQQGNIYVSLESDEPAEIIKYIIEKMKLENSIVFAADYPHASEAQYFPEYLNLFMENIAKPANLSSKQIEKILGENAKILYNI
ncbi:MAG: amidohydrolase family protein [Saccharolobus sp.]|uniref:amidohydrolase family protein n=1 Tax=Saccharolobus TaxID=2100760 RepID=UPI001F110134|nr:amidohydrolase family protein [Saccharolobus shibatae]MCH4815826.1 amidohydrolase [Saccharolobus shibatae]